MGILGDILGGGGGSSSSSSDQRIGVTDQGRVIRGNVANYAESGGLTLSKSTLTLPGGITVSKARDVTIGESGPATEALANAITALANAPAPNVTVSPALTPVDYSPTTPVSPVATPTLTHNNVWLVGIVIVGLAAMFALFKK